MLPIVLKSGPGDDFLVEKMKSSVKLNSMMRKRMTDTCQDEIASSLTRFFFFAIFTLTQQII